MCTNYPKQSVVEETPLARTRAEKLVKQLKYLKISDEVSEKERQALGKSESTSLAPDKLLQANQ